MKKVFRIFTFVSLVLSFYSCKKEKQDPILTTSIEQFSTTAKGESVFVEVKSNENWTATSSQSWSSISLPKSTGNQTIQLVIKANPSATDRSAEITITSASLVVKTIKIDQRGEITITTSSSDVKENAVNATQTLIVTSNSTWTVSSSESWCTLSEPGAVGDKSITVNCTNNLTRAARQASITFKSDTLSKTITVTQSGGEVKLNDDFNNNTKGWPLTTNTPDSIVRKIENGFLVFDNQYKRGLYYSMQLPALSDANSNFIIEAKIIMITGTSIYGITYGALDYNNFCVFTINSLNRSIGLIKSSSTWQPFSFNMFNVDAISSNSNILKMIKIGSTIDYYINDILVVTKTNISMFGGKVGLYLENSTSIKVDYIKVTEL